MKLFFPSLLDELVAYGNDKVLESKVLRIYWKCVKSGHNNWANAIEQKYSRFFKKSDLSIAFGWALMASKTR
jgi:hypothetical protein